MADQDLDSADIFALLEQMSRKRVPQGMHRDALTDVRGLRRFVHCTVQLPCAQRIHRIKAREKIATRQNFALGSRVAPPGTQSLEQDRRKQRVAVLLPFPFLDAQEHPLAVNIADLQCSPTTRSCR